MMNDKINQSPNLAAWNAFELHNAIATVNQVHVDDIKNIKLMMSWLAETLDALLYLMKNKQKQQKKSEKP